jgi:hypothetical protein
MLVSVGVASEKLYREGGCWDAVEDWWMHVGAIEAPVLGADG